MEIIRILDKLENKVDKLGNKVDKLVEKLENKVDKLENNRCFSFPNFCSWSRYVLPLHVIRFSKFDIGFGPPISPNTSIFPLRVKSLNSQQSNPVSEVEGEKQSAADGVEPMGRITSNASDVLPALEQVNETCCFLNKGISSGDFFLIVLLSAFRSITTDVSKLECGIDRINSKFSLKISSLRLLLLSDNMMVSYFIE